MSPALRVPRARAIARLALALPLIGTFAFSASPARSDYGGGTIALAVDASEAPRKILHAKLTIPVEPGKITLVYPKWIPGEHGPTGPLTDIAGLRFLAGGKPLRWERDLVDMHAVSCEVPAGASPLEVSFDFISAASPEGFSSAASCTEKLLLLSWNQVLLYPAGRPADDIHFAASLKLPAEWKYGTALPVQKESGGAIQFAPTSLTALVDSPVLAGANFRRVELATSPPQYLDMAADGPEALAIPDAEVTKLKRLMNEAYGLFGARHFREYHFLLTLSDHVAHFGLEHHESSDDRVSERTWLDDDLRIAASGLLAHELVHSWNGKYRRPAGLATADYQQPMKDDLLWVYEGLTEYYGELLAARGGLISAKEWIEELAADALSVSEPGRTWRPLQDTADSAPFLYLAGGGWGGWRRSTDFYAEGALIWLEADVTIRSATGGKKSLDDFCALFHGENDNGRIYVKPYAAAEVYDTLNKVAPYDWKKFFETRLRSKSADVPSGGIEGAGYRLVYTDAANMFTDPWSLDGGLNAYASLGVHVAADGTVDNAWPSRPAYAAGLSNGMKIIAVNGRRFSTDDLKRAIAASKDSPSPIELIVENGSYFRTVQIDYHGGLRYPHLERVGNVDVLAEIAAPRVK